MRSPVFSRVLIALSLLVPVFLVFWPGLSGGFLFDDFSNIVSNPRVHLQSLDPESIWRALTAYQPGAIGRPLATLGFALDYMAGAKEPLGYKLHSLCVHLLNTLLVFAFALRLLTLPSVAFPRARVAALLVALAWAMHPLQVSTVLYVVQRMEMLVATLMLMALMAYLQGRLRQRGGRDGRAWLCVSALLAGAGLLAKESAILFPLYALVLELTVLRFEAADPRTSRFLRLAYAAGCLATVVVFFGWLVPRYASPEGFVTRDFTMGERLLTQLRVLPLYLGQIVFPAPGSMTFYYDNFPKSTGLLEPWTTLAGGLTIAMLISFAFFLRRRAPLASLGILWFFASHALTSNALNLELVFEHRNYLALLGIVLAAADGLRRLPGKTAFLKTAVTASLLVAFAALTLVRSATWGDELLLATDFVRKNPTSSRASNDLATLYVGMSHSDPSSPFFHMAQQEFERGAALPGSSPLPEQGLILMAATTGQPVDDRWWLSLIDKIRTQPPGPQQMAAMSGLMDQYRAGIPLDPHRLGVAYSAMLLRYDRWNGWTYADFADFALYEMDDPALAEEMFLKAVSQDPADDALANLVVSHLTAEGHGKIAVAVLNRLEELGHPPTLAPTGGEQ